MLNEKNIVDTEEDASMEVIEENEENEGGAEDGVDEDNEDNGENGATNHLNIPSTFELANVLVVQPSTLQNDEKEKSAVGAAAVDV